MMSVQDSLAAMLHGLTDIDIMYTAEIEELKRKIDYKDGLLKDRNIMDTHEHERYVKRANLRIIELDDENRDLKKEQDRYIAAADEIEELKEQIENKDILLKDRNVIDRGEHTRYIARATLKRLELEEENREAKESLKKEWAEHAASLYAEIKQLKADNREHFLACNHLSQVETLYDCELSESKMLRRKIEDLKKQVDRRVGIYKETIAEKTFSIKNLHKEVADKNITLTNVRSKLGKRIKELNSEIKELKENEEKLRPPITMREFLQDKELVEQSDNRLRQYMIDSDPYTAEVKELRKENLELKEKLSTPIHSSPQGATVQTHTGLMKSHNYIPTVYNGDDEGRACKLSEATTVWAYNKELGIVVDANSYDSAIDEFHAAVEEHLELLTRKGLTHPTPETPYAALEGLKK